VHITVSVLREPWSPPVNPIAASPENLIADASSLLGLPIPPRRSLSSHPLHVGFFFRGPRASLENPVVALSKMQ
jgi:hypothetical protein